MEQLKGTLNDPFGDQTTGERMRSGEHFTCWVARESWINLRKGLPLPRVLSSFCFWNWTRKKAERAVTPTTVIHRNVISKGNLLILLVEERRKYTLQTEFTGNKLTYTQRVRGEGEKREGRKRWVGEESIPASMFPSRIDSASFLLLPPLFFSSSCSVSQSVSLLLHETLSHLLLS